MRAARLLPALVNNFADARAKAHAILTNRCDDAANVIEAIILKMT